MSEKSRATSGVMFNASVITGNATAPPPSLVIPIYFNFIEKEMIYVTTNVDKPATVAPRIITSGIANRCGYHRKILNLIANDHQIICQKHDGMKNPIYL